LARLCKELRPTAGTKEKRRETMQLVSVFLGRAGQGQGGRKIEKIQFWKSRSWTADTYREREGGSPKKKEKDQDVKLIIAKGGTLVDPDPTQRP